MMTMKHWIQTVIQTLCPALWETELLYQWALSASLLILAVLAIRRVLKGRLSSRVRYALWALVLLRLLIPFQVPLDLPAAPARAELPYQMDHPTIYMYEPPRTEGVVRSALERTEREGEARFIQYTEDGGSVTTPVPVWTRFQYLLSIWFQGAVVLAAVLLGVNLHFGGRLRRRRRRLERSDCKLSVYVASGLPSPCLYGLFRPAIYLTPETAEDEAALRHVLAHEYTHYAHGDHIWAVLRCVCLALHWYNPLVWLAAFLSRRDSELACDEGAVARLGEEERIPYGRTLVGLTARRGSRPADLLTCSTAMTEGHKTIQQRVALLVKAPKTRKAALVLALILAAVAAVFAFSKGQEPEPTEYDTFLARVADAQSIRVVEPAYSSRAYPDAIADSDLLAQAKEMLHMARVVSPEEGKGDWNDIATSVHFSSLGLYPDAADEEGKTYCLSGQETADYILIDEPDGPGCIPIAALDRGTIDTLLSLARRQNERNGEREEKWIELPDRVASALAYLAADEAFLAENARLWSVTPEEVARWLTDDTAGACPVELTLRYGSFDLPELEALAPCWHLICWDGEGQLSYVLYLPEGARQTLEQWCSDVAAPQRVVREQFNEMGMLCEEGDSYSIWDTVRKLEATYVVAQYTPNQGEGSVWLFVLEASKGALKARYRFDCPLPKSMGVEVRRFAFPGRTVLFGAVGDQLWTDLDADPKKVEFTGVQVLYGQEEQTVVVKNNSAFLICLPGETEIEDIVFLTGEGAAGRLSELPFGGNMMENSNENVMEN